VTLGVPQAQVLDVPLAGWIRAIVLGVRGRRLSEELLPATAPLQLVRMLKGVPRLVTHDPHAFGARRTFNVQKLVVLETPQARMRQVKRNGETRNVCRREPVVAQPDVRPEAEEPLIQFRVQPLDALLQPGSLDREAEVPDAHSEKAVA
jgi:hypothetical protein